MRARGASAPWFVPFVAFLLCGAALAVQLIDLRHAQLADAAAAGGAR